MAWQMVGKVEQVWQSTPNGMTDAFGVDFRKRFINHPTLKRTVEIIAVEINTGHGLHPSQSFEIQNERAPISPTPISVMCWSGAFGVMADV